MSVADKIFWRGGSDQKSKSEAGNSKQQFMIQEDGDIVSIYRAYCAWRSILETGIVPQAEMDQETEDTNTEQENKVDDDADEDATTEFGAALRLQVNRGQFNADLWRTQDNRNEDDDEGDDNDTSSQHSQESSPIKQANPKGIAYDFSQELRQIFRITKGWKRGDNDVNREQVDGESLRRLITAGYFMNAARVKPRAHFQYYALCSDVVGSLFRGSALYPCRKSKAGSKRVAPAQWILFDSILRLTSTTYLSQTTPIQEEWISEESPMFGVLCQENSRYLPLNVLEWSNLSFEVVRAVFGKGFSKVRNIEATLKCNITVDRDAGKMMLYCTPHLEETIHSTMNAIIAKEEEKMKNDIREEVYMAGTRVVLGKGFVVSELLFRDEFSTIYIKNMGQTTERELQLWMERVRNQSAPRHHHQADPTVRSIELTSQVRGKMSATIDFISKQTAKQVYDNFRGELSKDGEVLVISPGLGGPAAWFKASHRRSNQTIVGERNFGAKSENVLPYCRGCKPNFITNCCNIQALCTLSPIAIGVFPSMTRNDNQSSDLPPIKRVQHPMLGDTSGTIFNYGKNLHYASAGICIMGNRSKMA